MWYNMFVRQSPMIPVRTSKCGKLPGRLRVGVVLLVFGLGGGQGWGQVPRPSRRPPQPPLPVSTSPAPLAPAVPLTGVTLEGNTLSLQVQNQDVRAVIERIASQGEIDVAHLDSLPEKRISLHFDALPVVEGLRRLLRVADIPGYALITTPEGTEIKVQRIIFLKAEEHGSSPTRIARGPSPVATPPVARRPPSPTPPQPQPEAAQEKEEQQEEEASSGSNGTVFEELRSNATARRLLNQVMHPNEQVRDRALESLVRLIREDEKQRDLLEFLEPLMEDLSSEDKQTQDEAREEIRQLLRQ